MSINSKIKFLFLGIAIIALLSYHFAIRKTVELNNQHTQLKHKISLFQNSPSQLAVLRQKEMYYDSILLVHQLSGSSIQNKLLSMINSYADANNIQVLNFSEPHSIVDLGVNAITYQFTLRGHYNPIISLIYKIEMDSKLGEIIHLEFDRKENLRTSKYTLESTVMLKSFG